MFSRHMSTQGVGRTKHMCTEASLTWHSNTASYSLIKSKRWICTSVKTIFQQQQQSFLFCQVLRAHFIQKYWHNHSVDLMANTRHVANCCPSLQVPLFACWAPCLLRHWASVETSSFVCLGLVRPGTTSCRLAERQVQQQSLRLSVTTASRLVIGGGV